MTVLCLLENVYIDMRRMNILYNKAVGVLSEAKQSGFILLCLGFIIFKKCCFVLESNIVPFKCSLLTFSELVQKEASRGS